MSPFDAESRYANVTGYEELLLDLSVILFEVMMIGLNLYKEVNRFAGVEM